jgi:CRP-like cAMP-binding protein
MRGERLRYFTDFAGLSPVALERLAARLRCVRLPAGRWLVRPGRALGGRLYLLDGRLRLGHDGHWQQVGPADERARAPVYPGCSAAQTLTPAELISVDAQTLGWLRDGEHLGLPVVDHDAASWQRRFLASPLLQRLSPQLWQRILRAMVAAAHDAGERVVTAGAPAECCYVLCKGRAEIVAPGDGARLATVLPGDLFGEDALITGAVRNASVVMSAAGASMRLAADRFEAWLLDAVIVAVDAPGGRRLVDLDGMTRGALAVPLARIRDVAGELPADTGYAITGGTLRERRLAAFLLGRAGIDARPLIG